jgi:hypothetical protein
MAAQATLVAAGATQLTLTAGSGVTLTPVGATLVVAASGSGGVTTAGLTVGRFPYASGASALSDSFWQGGAATNFQPTVDTARSVGGVSNRIGGLYLNGTPFGFTYDNASFGTGAKVNTLTNGPNATAGNPTKWLVVTCDGATGVIPWWPT